MVTWRGRSSSTGRGWLRSPGGNARIGNQAGRIIRDNGLQTRIPEGWACFSACNFLFMGGFARFVDPGYLANIQRQLIRHFRRPGGSTSDVAEALGECGAELLVHASAIPFAKAAAGTWTSSIEGNGPSRQMRPKGHRRCPLPDTSMPWDQA